MTHVLVDFLRKDKLMDKDDHEVGLAYGSSSQTIFGSIFIILREPVRESGIMSS